MLCNLLFRRTGLPLLGGVGLCRRLLWLLRSRRSGIMGLLSSKSCCTCCCSGLLILGLIRLLLASIRWLLLASIRWLLLASIRWLLLASIMGLIGELS